MVCEKIQNQTRQGFLLKVVKVDGFSQARKAETEAEAGVVFFGKIYLFEIPDTKNNCYQKNYIFMIRKDRIFYDPACKAVAILDKKLKIFIFVFFNLNSFFSEIFSALIFNSAVTFQQY